VEVLMKTTLKLIGKQENRKQVPALKEKVVGTTEDERDAARASLSRNEV
jgi:hypothetical protein